MGQKKQKMKTLYLEHFGEPLRLTISSDTVDRIKSLQRRLKRFSLKPNEYIYIELDLKQAIVRITKNLIDIGVYGYEGWESFIYELDLKTIDDIPELFFSRMYIFYLKNEKDFLRKEVSKAFHDLVLPEHREYLVWKQIEGSM